MRRHTNKLIESRHSSSVR